MKKTAINKLIDILIGIGLCAFSIIVFIYSFSIEQKARMFPVFISLALAVFTGLIVVKNVRLSIQKDVDKQSNHAYASGKIDSIMKSIKKDLLPLLISGLCILFVLLYPVIGFEISAFSLLFFTMAIIDLKEAIRKIYIAIIVPVVLIAIFYFGLKLRIPLLFDNILAK